MDAVTGETSIYIIRFLLDAAEAGFVPAVILSMTYWFPAAKRVAVLGVFTSLSHWPTHSARRCRRCC